jgi:PiT family inorganic phosphate transporter
MLWISVIFLSTLFVAYANGANDNFKGVATLFGSGTTNYRVALLWATFTTFAGSVCAFYFAQNLIATFSGRGLFPDAFLTDPVLLSSVILASGVTVYLAAKIGLPVSTTHSLTGALIGAGWMAVGERLNLSTLGKHFLAPLLISPFLALALALTLYPLFHYARRRLGIKSETCLCIGKNAGTQYAAVPMGRSVSAIQAMPVMAIVVADNVVCEQNNLAVYSGRLIGIQAQKVLDGLHFLSAGAVSFARGLNDTPKIVALGAAFGVIALEKFIFAVAIAMSVGGLMSARRVAETMSTRITTLNHGQGLTANLITSTLVMFASHIGIPVSTTHVSCGALFGIGAANGTARWLTIGNIFSAWVLTLPAAATLAAITYCLLR